MRASLLLLLLAGLFGLAALWQERHVEALRSERRQLEAEAAGELARTSSGDLAAGHGVVLVGAASGAEPVPRPASWTDSRRAPEPAPRAPTLPTGTNGSVEPTPPDARTTTHAVEVQPAQTLSGICYLHYGTASRDLVAAVARHNGLEDPDQLQVGAALELPELGALLEQR